MKYPKIRSLFKRGEDFKFTEKFVSEFLSEFKDFQWVCYEKLNGMNIRIFCDYKNNDFKYFGRTDNADIPEHLQLLLNKIVDTIKGCTNISTIFSKVNKFILYGEGFGSKIQSGGLYFRDAVAFNVFDCYAFISEEKGFWLDELMLNRLTTFLKIDKAPVLEPMTIAQASVLVKSGFKSKYGSAQSEGLVIKTKFPLFDSFGERLIFKLKTKDF